MEQQEKRPEEQNRGYKGRNFQAYMPFLSEYCKRHLTQDTSQRRPGQLVFFSPFAEGSGSSGKKKRGTFTVYLDNDRYYDFYQGPDGEHKKGNLCTLIAVMNGLPEKECYSNTVRDVLIQEFGKDLMYTNQTMAQKADFSQKRARALTHFSKTDAETASLLESQMLRLEQKMVDNLEKTGTLFGEELGSIPYSCSEKGQWKKMKSENYIISMLSSDKGKNNLFVAERAREVFGLTPDDTAAPVVMIYNDHGSKLGQRNLEYNYRLEDVSGDKGALQFTERLAPDAKSVVAEVKRQLKASGRAWPSTLNFIDKAAEQGSMDAIIDRVRQQMDEANKRTKNQGMAAWESELATAFFMHSCGWKQGIKVNHKELIIERLKKDMEKVRETERGIVTYADRTNSREGNALMQAATGMRKRADFLMGTGRRAQLNEKKKQIEIKKVAEKKDFKDLKLIATADMTFGEEKIPKGATFEGRAAYLKFAEFVKKDREAYTAKNSIYHGKTLNFRVECGDFKKDLHMTLGNLDSGYGKTMYDNLARLALADDMHKLWEHKERDAFIDEFRDKKIYEEQAKGGFRFKEAYNKNPKKIRQEIYESQLYRPWDKKREEVRRDLKVLEATEKAYLADNADIDKQLEKSRDLVKQKAYKYDIPVAKQDQILEAYGSRNVLNFAPLKNDKNQVIGMTVTLRRPLSLSHDGLFIDTKNSKSKELAAVPSHSSTLAQAAENLDEFRVKLHVPSYDPETEKTEKAENIFVGKDAVTAMQMLMSSDRTAFEQEKTGYREVSGFNALDYEIEYKGKSVLKGNYLPGEMSLGKYNSVGQIIENESNGRFKGLKTSLDEISKYPTTKEEEEITRKLEQGRPLSEIKRQEVLNQTFEPMIGGEKFPTRISGTVEEKAAQRAGYIVTKAIVNSRNGEESIKVMAELLQKQRPDARSAILETEEMRAYKPSVLREMEKLKEKIVEKAMENEVRKTPTINFSVSRNSSSDHSMGR